MPKIRDLIPTENLYGGDFEPWLDMDLSDFQQNYSQAMQGDPSGRGSAIGIGNLLGLGQDANNQFVVPEDYQKQWDESGNWAPTNEIDQMSLAYQQGNKMGANTTGGGQAEQLPQQDAAPTTQAYNPNPNMGSQGGLMPPAGVPPPTTSGMNAAQSWQSPTVTSAATPAASTAGGPAGMSDSDWLSLQYQQGNKLPTNVTGNQSQFAGLEGTTPNNGVNAGGAITPSQQSYLDSQGGASGTGPASSSSQTSSPWGGGSSVMPMGGGTDGSGIGLANRWQSPTATSNPNSNPGLGQYGPAQGVAGSGAATTPYNPSGPATPAPGGGNGNPYAGTSGGVYTGPSGPQGGGVLSSPNPGGGGTGTGTTSIAQPPGSVFPTGTYTQGSGVTQTNQPVDPNDPYAELFGLGGLASVPNINLGTMPTMSGGWAPGFEEAYNQNTANTAQGIKNIYGGMQLPQANAANIDLGQLSDLKPQQVNQSQALQALLSGQGYDPATMAKINAGSTDSINRQAGANRGSARLAAERAGLGGSPVQAAMEGQINRQRGDEATRQLNSNAIQNANVGMENFRQGAGLDFSREQNNMQQANAMALAKASQMLTAMSQNASNQQQANMSNFGAGVNKEMTSAGAQAGVVGGQGSAFGNASMQQQMNANQQNAGNAFNWALNQAGLNQNTNNTNANLQNSQWTTGVNGLLGLGGGNGGANYSAQGNALATQQQPTNALGSVLSNAGQALTQP